MSDHDFANVLNYAQKQLVETISAELKERRATHREEFKVWGTANLDALALCRDIRRVQDSFAAGIRRRRQIRRSIRRGTLTRVPGSRALAS